MSWMEQAEGRDEAERRARAGLVRSVLAWGPFAAASIGAFLFFAFDRIVLGSDYGSTWFLVVLLAIFSFLFGFQAIQPLLDLFGRPKEVTAPVTRKWARSDSLIIRSHYIRLETGHIFRIDRALHGDVAVDDTVRVRFYPRSATVIELDVQKKVQEEEAEHVFVEPMGGLQPGNWQAFKKTRSRRR